jgi:TPR repeat protein
MKIRFFGLLTCLLLLGIPFGFGHSGRTDANGGHNDRKNGGYHYHGTPPSKSPPSESVSGRYNESSAQTQTVAPVRPVVVPTEAQKAETDAKVIAWQIKQSAAGFASAQYDLGVRYLTGTGVEKDLDKAISLLESAAKQNHSLAQKRLSIALLEKEVLAAEKPAKSVDVFDVAELQIENEALRKETQALRRLLANEGNPSQQVPLTPVSTRSIPPQDNPAVSHAKSPSNESSWTLSSTGKRHNNRCRYFGSGKSCGQNDGVACKVCGG